MTKSNMFNEEVRDKAGELWAELLKADGDKDQVLSLMTASTLRDAKKLNEVNALTLLFMATHTWGSVLRLLGERGVPPWEVRDVIASDLFEASAALRAA